MVLRGVFAGHVGELRHRAAVDVAGEEGELVGETAAIAQLRHPVRQVERDRARYRRLWLLETSRNGVEARRLRAVVRLGFGSTPSRRKQLCSSGSDASNDTVEFETPATFALDGIDRHDAM
jgi:hypothetical protein